MSSPIDQLNDGLRNMQKLTAEKGGTAKSLEDVIMGALNNLGQAVGNMAGPFSGIVKNIGTKSAFAGLERESVTSKMINESAGNFSARGGALAELLMGESGLNMGKGLGDFSKLAVAAIEPMQHMAAEMGGTAMNMGESSLGSLQPMSTPSMGRSEGMSLA